MSATIYNIYLTKKIQDSFFNLESQKFTKIKLYTLKKMIKKKKDYTITIGTLYNSIALQSADGISRTISFLLHKYFNAASSIIRFC